MAAVKMHDYSIVLILKGYLPDKRWGISMLRFDFEKGDFQTQNRWKVVQRQTVLRISPEANFSCEERIQSYYESVIGVSHSFE